MFHFSRNVTRVVKAAIGPEKAIEAGVSLEAMTRLGCSPADRLAFFSSVTDFLTNIVPEVIGMDAKYSTAEVVRCLQGLILELLISAVSSPWFVVFSFVKLKAYVYELFCMLCKYVRFRIRLSQQQSVEHMAIGSLTTGPV